MREALGALLQLTVVDVRDHGFCGVADGRASRMRCGRCDDAVEQADEADEAFGGMVARMEMPPHARAGEIGRGHCFAAYPRCSMDPRCPESWPGGRHEASQPGRRRLGWRC